MIPLAKNVGFSAANNVGLMNSNGDLVAFVNPDVHVLPAELPILAHAIATTGGIVSPQLLNPDGSRQPNGRGLPFLVDKFGHRGVNIRGARPDLYLPAEEPRDLQPVAWTIGAVVAGSRTSINRMGGWNERFFLYYEDHDFGLRAWRSGLSVHLVNNVHWVHDWQRETIKFAWSPWRREVASALKFYSLYPGLLFETSRRRKKLALKYGVHIATEPMK